MTAAYGFCMTLIVAANYGPIGHARIETTTVYLRRYDRRNAMESVRDLSWGADGAAGDRRDNEQPRVDKPAQVGIGRSMSSDGAE